VKKGGSLKKLFFESRSKKLKNKKHNQTEADEKKPIELRFIKN
jgi:hypothetical protein